MKKIVLISICFVFLLSCNKVETENLSVSSLEVLNMEPKNNEFIGSYVKIMASLKYNIPVDYVENYGFYIAILMYSKDGYGTTIYERKVKDKRNGEIDLIYELRLGNYEKFPENIDFKFLLYRRDGETFGTTPLSFVDFTYKTHN